MKNNIQNCSKNDTNSINIISIHLQISDPVPLGTTTQLTTQDPFQPTCRAMSCEGKCGRKIDFAELYCSCHPDCESLNWCCPDYRKSCGDQSSLSDLMPADFCGDKGCYSCTHHPNFNRIKPFYAVAKCPANYPEGPLKISCDDPDPDSLAESLPLVDDDGVAYVNIYCAVCHGVPASSLTPLSHTIGCFQSDQYVDYFRQKEFPNITFSEVKSKMCDIKIERPSNLTMAHPFCVKMDADSCPVNHPLSELCEAIYEPQVIRQMFGSIFGRNKYCMACSSFRDRFYTCWTPFSSVPITIVDIGPFAFSVLFDFSSLYMKTDSDSSDLTDIAEPSVGNSGYKFSFINNSQETFVLSISGNIMQQHQGSVIDDVIDILQQSSLDFYNATVVLDRKQSSSEWQAPEVRVTAFLHNTGMQFLELSNSSLDSVSQFLSYNIWRLNTIQLSNNEWPLEQACTTSLKKYPFGKFYYLLQARMERNARPEDVVLFPLMIQWKLENQISSCHSVTNPPQYHQHMCKNSSLGRMVSPGIGLEDGEYAVCGDSLETNCSLELYSAQTLENLLGNIIMWKEKLKTMLEMNGRILACSEEIYQLRPTGQSPQYDLVQFVLTAVGCSLSLLGLLATFVVYIVFPDMRNLPGKCVMSLTAAMFAAQLFFVLGGLLAWRFNQFCVAVALIQHFFWLASFAWTNVMAFDLAKTFGRKTQVALSPKELSVRFKMYSAVGWTIPLAVVSVCAGLHFATAVPVGYGLDGVCWIRDPNALLIAFIAPITAHILINIAFFAYVVYSIHNINKLSQSVQTDKKSKRNTLVIYARISAVMCFTWLVGYLSNAFPAPALWYAFTVLNSCQGIYVFIAFVLNSRVLARLAKKCGCKSDEKMRPSSAASKQTGSSRL